MKDTVLQQGTKFSPKPWPNTPWGRLAAWFRENISGTQHKFCGGTFIKRPLYEWSSIKLCDRCGFEVYRSSR